LASWWYEEFAKNVRYIAALLVLAPFGSWVEFGKQIAKASIAELIAALGYHFSHINH
jgi:Zn-dependent protease